MDGLADFFVSLLASLPDGSLSEGRVVRDEGVGHHDEAEHASRDVGRPVDGDHENPLVPGGQKDSVEKGPDGGEQFTGHA